MSLTNQESSQDHKIQNWILCGFIFIIGAILIYIAIYDPTTGGDGDSICHYMFSRYSWDHPAYFIDQWAKPLFTLISSPFSQFGFAGMRVFNVICTLLTCYFIFRIGVKTKRKSALLVPVILLCIPYFTLKIFSGLTEYFYCALLTGSILLTLHKRYFWAAIMISFFPFCRSEGYFALGIYAAFLIWVGDIKYIPLLGVGHGVYELLGGIFFGRDFGWTWNKIPYKGTQGTYGQGQWWDMADQLYQLVEWPVLCLVMIGLMYKVIIVFKDRSFSHVKKVDVLLIYGNAIAFFVAHTLFWKFGLFNSAGLGRVLIAIMPLLALIAIDAFKLLDNYPRVYLWVIGLAMIFVVSHPFNRKKGGFIFKKGMNDIPQHTLIKEQLKPYLDSLYTDTELYYIAPFIAVARHENIFDQNTSQTWFRKEDLDSMPGGSIFIWDSKFSLNDAKIQLGDLESDSRFSMDTCFISDTWNGRYEYCIFKKVQD